MVEFRDSVCHPVLPKHSKASVCSQEDDAGHEDLPAETESAGNGGVPPNDDMVVGFLRAVPFSENNVL